MTFDGARERAYILASGTGVGAFAGGRVYPTGVPDDEDLERFADGKVKPYLIMSFSTPFANSRDRGVSGGERAQPHTMPFMATAIAGDADSAFKLIAAVQNRLVGVQPHPAATEIKATGGFSTSERDSTSRPTRFKEIAWFTTIVNLDGSAS